jgi:hypothetical protein
MTNNVGMTMRQARPQYLSNSGLGAIAGGISGLFGGRKQTGGMTPGVNEMKVAAIEHAGQIRTQPVGAPVPISGGTMTTMPVGRPMPMPQAPVNVRSVAGGTPMNPLGRGGVTLMGRGNPMNPMGRGGVTLMGAGNRFIR